MNSQEKPKVKRHHDPAYDGLAMMLSMNPSLKNPEFAKRMIAPGPHLAKHLRTLVSGKGGPTKAQIEKEKQEARLSLLT